MDAARINGVNTGIHLSEQVSVIRPSQIVSHVQSADDPGRVIRSINGQTPSDLIDACHMLLNVKAGDSTRLEFTDGSMRSVTAVAVDDSASIASAKSVLGLRVAALTPSLTESQHITAAEGVFVEQVQPEGLAAAAGLEDNDVILQWGRSLTLTPAQLADAIKAMPNSGAVPVGIVRGGKYMVLNLRLNGAATRPQ
jgi:serine protease Do